MVLTERFECRSFEIVIVQTSADGETPGASISSLLSLYLPLPSHCLQPDTQTSANLQPAVAVD